MQISNFQAISWREQVTFDEMIMISALYQTYTLSWIFIVLPTSLKQQSVGRHVTSLRYIILILSNPVLVVLLNAVCLTEKQQIPIL